MLSPSEYLLRPRSRYSARKTLNSNKVPKQQAIPVKTALLFHSFYNKLESGLFGQALEKLLSSYGTIILLVGRCDGKWHKNIF